MNNNLKQLQFDFLTSLHYEIEVIDRDTIKVNNEIVNRKYCGGNRLTFFYKDVVIKFDDFTRRCWVAYQCKSEFEFWNMIKDEEYVKYFAKLIEYREFNGYRCTIQEKINGTLGGNITGNNSSILDDIRFKYGLSDMHGANYFIDNNGDLKIVDYALYSNCNVYSHSSISVQSNSTIQS